MICAFIDGSIEVVCANAIIDKRSLIWVSFIFTVHIPTFRNSPWECRNYILSWIFKYFTVHQVIVNNTVARSIGSWAEIFFLWYFWQEVIWNLLCEYRIEITSKKHKQKAQFQNYMKKVNLRNHL